VAAALLADFVVNFIVLGTPQSFTPITTIGISLLVGAPVCFYLINQRFDVQRVREELSSSIVEKDLAAVEIQLRRQDAERARADAELALEQLRESEARYRMLTDRATDIIVRFDRNRIIEFASPSVRQLGYEPDALVGRDVAEFIHTKDRPPGFDLRSDQSPLVSGQNEFRVCCANGEWVWLQGSPAPIHDEAGNVLGTVTVLRDVTARRAIEDELRHKRIEAEAALTAKSDFLANMTHELRTPLNAIIGFSGLLNKSADLGARDARQVELIWDASQTLLRVVNDVLDFSKLEAGAFELDLHAFDPKQIAQSTVSLLTGQAAAKGLTLSLSAEGLEGSLLGDGGRLRQVLMNFISNAVKFTARGDIHVLVRQTADESAGGEARRLRLAVRDSGIGVPPDQLDAIFGRFTQADASVSRQYGGTGLGLAISKRIIDMMGGEIGVFSQMGEGSTFWVEVSMPGAAISSRDEASVDSAGIDRPLRLLVVEDNAVNRELIRALLQPFDVMIETAADGVEAVEAASRAAFDMILMDVQMPNMDGLTAARHIRAAACPGERRTPIIAMTANVLPEQIARCLEAGMDDHLGKPIDPQKLLETLSAWSAAAEDDAAEQVSA